MKVYEAIRLVTAAMSSSGITKGRKNTTQGYNFRGIDDVLNALSGPLCEAGLVILPRVIERIETERTTKNGGALFSVTCKVDFDFISAEDGSKHTVTTYGEAMDSADKATNKAMSAAFKDMALLAFCIPTEASPDTDADYVTHDVRPTAASAPPVFEPLKAPSQKEPVHPAAALAMLNAVENAVDMKALRGHYNAAFKLATETADAVLLDKLVAAKDARKLVLDAQDKKAKSTDVPFEEANQ